MKGARIAGPFLYRVAFGAIEKEPDYRAKLSLNSLNRE